MTNAILRRLKILGAIIASSHSDTGVNRRLPELRQSTGVMSDRVFIKGYNVGKAFYDVGVRVTELDRQDIYTELHKNDVKLTRNQRMVIDNFLYGLFEYQQNIEWKLQMECKRLAADVQSKQAYKGGSPASSTEPEGSETPSCWPGTPPRWEHALPCSSGVSNTNQQQKRRLLRCPRRTPQREKVGEGSVQPEESCQVRDEGGRGTTGSRTGLGRSFQAERGGVWFNDQVTCKWIHDGGAETIVSRKLREAQEELVRDVPGTPGGCSQEGEAGVEGSDVQHQGDRGLVEQPYKKRRISTTPPVDHWSPRNWQDKDDDISREIPLTLLYSD